MTFVKYDKRDVKKHYYRFGKNQRFINEFMESGFECIEVKDFEHRDAYSCANALRRSVERMNIRSIKVISRNNRVFMIREVKNNEKSSTEK